MRTVCWQGLAWVAMVGGRGGSGRGLNTRAEVAGGGDVLPKKRAGRADDDLLPDAVRCVCSVAAVLGF